jgi:hypothetical protein
MKKLIHAGSIVLLTILTSLLFNISTVKADDSMYLDEQGNLYVNGSITVTDNMYGGFNIVPIGTILPWHKNIIGETEPLELPDGFVECNGQTLNDLDSSLNGCKIPNLNSDLKFIRGGNISGIGEGLQNDSIQNITGSFSSMTHATAGVPLLDYHWGAFYSGNSTNELSAVLGTGSTQNATTYFDASRVVRTSNETRPTYVTMVWIMRIK